MNNHMTIRLATAILVATVLLIAMLTFQVRENEHAILTRFGRPVRVLTAPGLYGKWPWPIESVHRSDARLDFYETRLTEALTRDKRNVLLPVYVAWKIEDPLLFLQSVGSPSNARIRLDNLVTSAKNTALGTFDFHHLVSTNRAEVRIQELEHIVQEQVATVARSNFGIAIAHVGVKGLLLPEANTAFVFDRMRAERAQYAAKFRAEGQQQADEIRARTDAEKTVILAEARRYAEETRGKSEAEAARIYGAAHAQDPDLYRFLRELETLRHVVGTNTTIVLDSGSPPFRVLQNNGGPSTATGKERP